MSYNLICRLAVAGIVAAWVPHVVAGQQVARLGPTPPVVSEPPSGNAVVLGRVVDAATNRPIAGANVILGGSSGPQLGIDGLAVPPPTVMTSSEGYFVFRSLAKGSYQITVNAPGYVSGANGRYSPEGPSRPVVLEQDQRTLDVVIKLWRFGTISGRIVDESGEPVVGTQVRALRRNPAGRFAVATGFAATDDRGIYRLSTLVPAEYVVAVPSVTTAMPQSAREILRQEGPAAAELRRELSPAMLGAAMIGSSSGGIPMGDLSLFPGRQAPEPGQDGRIFAYPTVFYPSATSTASATIVTLTSGQERTDVDIQLKLSPTSRVSGSVASPDGPVSHIGLRLVPAFSENLASDTNLETAMTLAGADGRFTFLGVPPGSYTIKALRMPRPVPTGAGVSTVITMNTSGGGMVMMSSSGPGALPPAPTEPTLSGEVPVVVGDRDVSNVTVMLRPGARVSGTVVFEGGRPPANELQRFGISLGSTVETGALTQAVPVDTEGRFITAQHPDGRYTLNLTAPPPGWSVKSALASGRNMYERPLDLKGEDVSGVIVTMTKQTTDLLGAVRRGTGSGDPNAVVIVFPADYQSWIEDGMLPRRVRSSAAQSDGTYEITGLSGAGEYLVAAIGGEVVVDTRNPATIAALARIATRVSVADGEKKTLALTVAQLR